MVTVCPKLLIRRGGCPEGSIACSGSRSCPPVMISWDFTASRAAHPPIAAADSSINDFAAAGPVGGADEHPDNTISNASTIATIKHLHTSGCECKPDRAQPAISVTGSLLLE